KRIVDEGMALPLAEALTLEQDETAKLIVTPDALEGIAAFVEKREARFPGRDALRSRVRSMSVPYDPSVVTDRGRTIYGATAPGAGIPCERDTPLSQAELDEVVELIASAREERRSALMPPRLMTRDWPSVVQVVLLLDERLGWAPAGWK